VGYSVSPLHDPLLESMLSASTPRQQLSLAARCGSSNVGLERSISGGRGAAPPSLTFPAMQPPGGGGAAAAAAELGPSPFDFPAVGATPEDVDAAGEAGEGLTPADLAASREDAACLAAAADSASTAAAVGAFMKLLHAAPPLAGAAPVALGEALRALAAVRGRLQGRAAEASPAIPAGG
jgi:hypothetical protein